MLDEISKPENTQSSDSAPVTQVTAEKIPTSAEKAQSAVTSALNSIREKEVKSNDSQKTTEAAVEAEAKTGEPPSLPDPLKLYAQNTLGLSEKELSTFKTPDELEKFISMFEGRILSLGQTRRQPEIPSQMQNKQPEQTGDQGNFKLEPYKLGLSKEEYDENVVSEFEKMNQYYSGVIKNITEKLNGIDELSSLKTGFDTYMRQVQIQQAIDRDNQIDSEFSELTKKNKDLEQVFGAQSVGELDRNSKEFHSRVKILETVDALNNGYRSIGKEPPDFKTVFDRALKIVFPDYIKKQVETEISKQLDNTKKTITNRPSNISPSSPNNDSPIDRAKAIVDRIRQEKGAFK